MAAGQLEPASRQPAPGDAAVQKTGPLPVVEEEDEGMSEDRLGSPKKDTMGRLQDEIASANSRAETAPKTPPEAEILKQAMLARTLSREGLPLSSCGLVDPSPPTTALAGVREDAFEDSSSESLPLLVPGGRGHTAAVAPPPLPIKQPPPPARPSWLGIARRLPQESRASIGAVDTRLPAIGAAASDLAEASAVQGSAQDGARHDLRLEIAELRRGHERQLAEVRSEIQCERAGMRAMIEHNQELTLGLRERDHELRTCSDELLSCAGQRAEVEQRLHAESAEARRLAETESVSERRAERCGSELARAERGIEGERCEKARAMQEVRTYRGLVEHWRSRVEELERERLPATPPLGQVGLLCDAASRTRGIETPHFGRSLPESPNPGPEEHPAIASDAPSVQLLASAAECGRLRAELAELRTEASAAVSSRAVAAETAAEAAAAAEDQRWMALWQDMLEPLRRRSTFLQERCEAECIALRSAHVEAAHWRSEAQELARRAAPEFGAPAEQEEGSAVQGEIENVQRDV